MRQFFFVALALLAMSVLNGCKKDPGEGGLASIKGKVFREVRLVLTNPATAQYTSVAADQDVYIIYGDEVSPGDRLWTNFEGEYEFLNLREGKYTVYVYSRDTTGQVGVDPDRMVIKREVEITDRKQILEVEDLTIYDLP